MRICSNKLIETIGHLPVSIEDKLLLRRGVLQKTRGNIKHLGEICKEESMGSRGGYALLITACEWGACKEGVWNSFSCGAAISDSAHFCKLFFFC